MATAANKEHIIIEWEKPETDGGSEITTYLVDRREKRSLRWTRINRGSDVYDTRLKVIGLMEGCEYQFRISAENAAGSSEPSESSDYILCKEPTCKIIFISHPISPFTNFFNYALQLLKKMHLRVNISCQNSCTHNDTTGFIR